MLREKLSFLLFCKLGSVLLLFTCCFLAGQYAGKYTKEKAEETTSSAFSGSETAPASENWGLSFPQEGASPQANATPEELSASWAYYIGNPKDKVLYLTFDCGFENGSVKKAPRASHLFRRRKLSGNQPRSHPTDAKRRSYRWQPYLPSPGYVKNFHKRSICQRAL